MHVHVDGIVTLCVDRRIQESNIHDRYEGIEWEDGNE